MLFRGAIFGGVAYYLIDYICKNIFELSKKGKYSKLANFTFGAIMAGLIIFSVVMSKVLNGIVIFSLNKVYIMLIIGVYWIYKGIGKFVIKK